MAHNGRIDLYALDYPALEDLLAGWGASRGIAREVWRWLYRDVGGMASVRRPSANDKGIGRPAANDKKIGRPSANDKGIGRPAANDKKIGRLAANDKRIGRPAANGDKWPAASSENVFGQMASVPQEVRERLAAETYLGVPQVLARQEAPGGATWKHLLALADGEQVEVVVLRYRTRYSACISTQVGCACGCRFCATGQMGFVRQLSVGEVIGQVLYIQRELMARDATLSNFVLMGMGEPLLNYDNVMAAVRRLSDPRGMALPQRRITLSTVGIVPGILRLAEEDVSIKLALSLHAATDAVRDALMPINQRYPLDELFAALRVYTTQTQRRVMLEWVMVAGVNDTPAQAEALVTWLRGIPAHVNLIHLNPTAAYAGQPASSEAVEAFVAVLDRAGIPHTMRQHRGASIQAGCGQLRARNNKKL